MRFICFILPCSARSTTPGRSRRKASNANLTCFPVVRNTSIFACAPQTLLSTSALQFPRLNAASCLPHTLKMIKLLLLFLTSVRGLHIIQELVIFSVFQSCQGDCEMLPSTALNVRWNTTLCNQIGKHTFRCALMKAQRTLCLSCSSHTTYACTAAQSESSAV